MRPGDGFNGYAIIPPTPGDPLGTLLGTPWGALGTLGDPLGTPWGPPGHPLGSPWGTLGVPVGPLGVPLGSPWVFLGTLWDRFGPFGDLFGTSRGPQGGPIELQRGSMSPFGAVLEPQWSKMGPQLTFLYLFERSFYVMCRTCSH